MTSRELMHMVKSICTGSSVACVTGEWYRNHLPDGEAYQTVYQLSILPGLCGVKCSQFEGADWQACGEAFQAAITTILESGDTGRADDVDVQFSEYKPNMNQ